jgi:hypothetical protein
LRASCRRLDIGTSRASTSMIVYVRSAAELAIRHRVLSI